MTVNELQYAFIKRLPVTYNPPNAVPIEYENISEIIYRRHSKYQNIMVSCRLVDKQRPNSTTVVRSKYISIDERHTVEDVVISINQDLKATFISGKKVFVNVPGKPELEYEKITALKLKLTDDNEIETYCIFESKYERLEVKGKYVTDKKKTVKIDYKAVIKLFIEKCPNLPKPQKLTDARKKAIQKAKQDGVDFEELFNKINASDFLSGRNDGWNNCSFDWCLKANNIAKILEGNFDNCNNKDLPRRSFDISELDKIK